MESEEESSPRKLPKFEFVNGVKARRKNLKRPLSGFEFSEIFEDPKKEEEELALNGFFLHLFISFFLPFFQ